MVNIMQANIRNDKIVVSLTKAQKLCACHAVFLPNFDFEQITWKPEE